MNIDVLKKDKNTISDLNMLSTYFKEIAKQLYHKEIVSRFEKEGFSVESDGLDGLILINGIIPVFIPSQFADSVYFYHPVDWERKEKWETECTAWQIKMLKAIYPFKQQLLEGLTTEKFTTVEDISEEIKTFLTDYPLVTKKLTNLHKTGMFEHLKSFKYF